MVNQTQAQPQSQAGQGTWWVLGKLDHPEFSLGPLLDHSLVHLGTLEAPSRQRETVSSHDSVTGIVFWADRPGVLNQSTVEAWNAMFPMARLIVVAGAWCDGELRTGKPVRGVERVRWTDWKAMSFARLSRVSWQPRTMTGSDWFYEPRSFSEALEHDAGDASVCRKGTVLIEAAYRESFLPLADLVEQAGFEAIWVRDEQVLAEDDVTSLSQPLVACITDDSGDRNRLQRTWPESLGELPSLVLTNYPRRSDLKAEDSSTTTLGKPYEIGLVLDWLKMLTRDPIAAELS